jgi:hypothetical protein
VKALEYGCYDINGYRFQRVKIEASCPLAATTNNGVVGNRATQQEAPEEPDVEDEADDQPYVTYRLVQF